MDIDQIPAQLARAIAFLSRLPVPDHFFDDDDGRASSNAALFPLAGLVIALPAALLVALMSWLHAPSALTAMLALLAMVLATGALHEDGLADCADAFGAGGDADRKLTILKDSQIGVYGALGLIFSIGLRGVALTVLVAVGPPLAAAFTVLAAATLSRAVMVWHWHHLSSARPDGVAGRAGQPATEATQLALGSGILLAIVGSSFLAGIFAALLSCLVAGLIAWGWTRHVDRKLGGQTGDTIGATQQITEIAFLVALVVTL